MQKRFSMIGIFGAAFLLNACGSSPYGGYSDDGIGFYGSAEYDYEFERSLKRDDDRERRVQRRYAQTRREEREKRRRTVPPPPE